MMTITAATLKTFTRTGPALVQFQQQLAARSRPRPFVRDCYVPMISGPMLLRHPEFVTVATNGAGMMIAELRYPQSPHVGVQFVGVEHGGVNHLFETVCLDSRASLAQLLEQRTSITPTFLRIHYPPSYLWTWCTNRRNVPDYCVPFTAAPEFLQTTAAKGQEMLELSCYYTLPREFGLQGLKRPLRQATALWLWGGLALYSHTLLRPFQKPQIELTNARRQIRMLLVAHDRQMLVPELEAAMQQRFADTARQCNAHTVRRALNTMITESEISTGNCQYLDPQQRLVDVPTVALRDAPAGNGRRKRELAAPLLPALAPMPTRL